MPDLPWTIEGARDALRRSSSAQLHAEQGLRDAATTTACVLHTGYITPGGYGRAWADGRVARAHRAAWEAVRGPVPPGLELHHVCENRACVNVDHLLAVTRKQHWALHMPTWARHAPTHCVNGHPFDAENTHVRSDNGRRQCRACQRARNRLYRKGKAA